jgi:proteasome lid subunit RPN8/RPN11
MFPEDSSMALVWTNELRSNVCRHSERGYPDEVCGLLIGEMQGEEKVVCEVVPVENAWEQVDERRRRFRIGPEVVATEERRAREAGLSIVGFYHSHPDSEPRPSETDREYAWPTYSYLIQGVYKGIALDIKGWVLKDDRSGYNEERLIERG